MSRHGSIGLRKFKTGALADNCGGVIGFLPISVEFQALLTSQITKTKITMLLAEMKQRLEQRPQSSLESLQRLSSFPKMKMSSILGSHQDFSLSQLLDGLMFKNPTSKHSSQVISWKLVVTSYSSGLLAWS